MNSKKFHIGDLLSIVGENLVSPRLEGCSAPMGGVHEILSFMSGEERVATHQLPRIKDECKPVLLGLYPWLTDIEFPGVPASLETDDIDDAWDWIERWLGSVAEQYGEYHDVWTLHPEDHEQIHQIFNAHGISGAENIEVTFEVWRRDGAAEFNGEFYKHSEYTCLFETWQDVDIYMRENHCSTEYLTRK